MYLKKSKGKKNRGGEEKTVIFPAQFFPVYQTTSEWIISSPFPEFIHKIITLKKKRRPVHAVTGETCSTIAPVDNSTRHQGYLQIWESSCHDFPCRAGWAEAPAISHMSGRQQLNTNLNQQATQPVVALKAQVDIWCTTGVLGTGELQCIQPFSSPYPPKLQFPLLRTNTGQQSGFCRNQPLIATEEINNKG